MEAMIFAAGLGTRLRPLTDDRPKALIDIGGVAILEHVARRLIAAGVDHIIINTHHFPDEIRSYVEQRGDFGVEVHFSHELDAPLDTAGGLRQARPLFRGDAPFFLHNCDVVSTVDLGALHEAHVEAGDGPLATLAVLPPSPERYLVFDERGLCGFAPRGRSDEIVVRPTVGSLIRHDFTGIHVAGPALLDTLETAPSSIIDHYVRLSTAGHVIAAQAQAGVDWIDIGTHEKLETARRQHAGR